MKSLAPQRAVSNPALNSTQAGTARRTTIVVFARYSGGSGGSPIIFPGGNNNNPNQNNRGGRLIIPGQSFQPPTPGRQQKLTVPDEGAYDNDIIPPPSVGNRFRPPPGFMNDELTKDETANMDPNEMLNKLRTRAGKWYNLAKYIPALLANGYTNSSIDEVAGITPAQQNKYVVSATVYESLKSSGQMKDDVLQRFDEGGENKLYPFRFLAVERRLAAAHYIVENDLDEEDCELLARAMKEYERRPTERQGYSDHPGDCLAFKYMRDAYECRRKEDAEKCVIKGLSLAVTEGATKRLEAVLADDNSSGSTIASMTVLRLNNEELGFRPLPVVGELGETSTERLLAAPRAKQQGSFGIFVMDSTANYPWVALPMWQALAMAAEPVALTIPNVSEVTAIVQGTRAVREEDKKRLKSNGLLLVDRVVPEVIDRDHFYLCARSSSPLLTMQEGTNVTADDKVVAAVLFVALPPMIDTSMATTADLLQL